MRHFLEYNRKRREKKVFFAQEHSRTKGVDAIGDSTPWRAAEDGPSHMVGARFTRRGDYASLTAILKGRFIYVGSFEVEHD